MFGISVEPDTRLKAIRVLVVEDDALIAEWIAEGLNDFGCTVAEPVATAEDAIAAIERNEPLDCVILDVRLEHGTSGDIAALLMRKGIPFVIGSGYNISLPEFRHIPCLTKPYTIEALARAITSAIDSQNLAAAACY